MSREVLVGFDLGGTKLAVVVADPDGTPLSTDMLPTDGGRGAEQAVARAITAARELVAGYSATVTAVGVSTMGITHEHGVELAPNVPGWNLLALPSLVRAAFAPAPVRLDNDVKAAALAEQMWGELRDVESGVYLNLGTGVAAALVVQGHIVPGAHGAAGEIGYWSRRRTETAGARSGNAPLEEYVGGAGARQRAREQLGLDGGVADLVSSDDPATDAFLTDLYDEIALHVSNLVIALDPERLVVGGGYVRTSDRVLAVLRQRLGAVAPFPPQVRLARFGADAGTAGAMALAVQARSSPPLSESLPNRNEKSSQPRP
ncbi:MAG: ROK family protein [Nocardioidaceae bacterium]